MEALHYRMIFPAFGYCFCCMLLCKSIGAELLRASSCANQTLILNCSSPSMLIAVYEAYFFAHNSSTCQENEIPLIAPSPVDNGNSTEECSEDVRIVLSKRCAGVRKCSYKHTDEKDRTCQNTEGTVVVQYDCVQESKLHRYCSSQLHMQEGYIASPGYPLFYPHLNQCQWTVEANEKQTVSLQTLHVQLRPPTVQEQAEYPMGDLIAVLHPKKYTCERDKLQIADRPLICGEGADALQSMELEGSGGVSIHFSTSEFYPGGGFLLHYKVKGCTSDQKTNASHVPCYCGDDCSFNSTNTESSRTVRCTEENQTLYTTCIQKQDIRQAAENRSMDVKLAPQPGANITNEIKDTPEKMKGIVLSSFILDVLLPSVLMGLLVLGNFVVLTVIFALRKKQREKLSILQEEENENPDGQQSIVNP